MPGVQLTRLFGGVNGAKTTVDLRGFGAFATSNTLILINGRRLNDVDMARVDLSTIPLHSIERIEITRGNSGAVLYGDNAIGGVINIVLKSGVGGPPVAIRAEAGVGSFNPRLANISAATNYGPWSTSFYGNAIKSDGYRDNNALDQRNGVGNLNYTTPDLKAFLTVTGDDQKLGFPGGRTVDPSIGLNQLVTNRKGTNTPFDYGNQQGASATAGFTKTIIDGVDLIVDGGVRDKKHKAVSSASAADHSLQLRRQPSADLVDHAAPEHQELAVRGAVADPDRHRLLRCDLQSDRPLFKGAQPIHVYDLSQQSLAGYWQHTIGLLPTTDFSYGARVQNTMAQCARSAESQRTRCAFFFERGVKPPARQQRNQLRAACGSRASLQQRVLGIRPRRARIPHAECRGTRVLRTLVPFAPFPGPPQDFRLKTQTSHDIEGGFRIKAGAFQMQSSIYNMDLENEIHFIPALFYNVNLDPTRRYGSETSASLRVSDTRAAARRPGLHPRRVSRRGVRRQGRSAGVELHRERRRNLEHLAELSGVRCHGARLERAHHGQ